MTVCRKNESMNERSIGIKSRYTNFHNIDNSARGDKTKLVTEKNGKYFTVADFFPSVFYHS